MDAQWLIELRCTHLIFVFLHCEYEYDENSIEQKVTEGHHVAQLP